MTFIRLAQNLDRLSVFSFVYSGPNLYSAESCKFVRNEPIRQMKIENKGRGSRWSCTGPVYNGAFTVCPLAFGVPESLVSTRALK